MAIDAEAGQAPIAWPQRLPSSSKDRRMQSRLCQIRHEAFVQWMESRSANAMEDDVLLSLE